MKHLKLSKEQLKDYSRVQMAIKRGRTVFFDKDSVIAKIVNLRAECENEVQSLINELNTYYGG